MFDKKESKNNKHSNTDNIPTNNLNILQLLNIIDNEELFLNTYLIKNILTYNRYIANFLFKHNFCLNIDFLLE